MNLADLPTNDAWSTDDWARVLAGSEFYEGAFTAPDGVRVDDITADRIAHVELWNATCPEGMADKQFAAIVRLVNGKWAGCMAWADTSGWGCQQGVYWRVVNCAADAVLYALDREGRHRLGAPLSLET